MFFSASATVFEFNIGLLFMIMAKKARELKYSFIV